MIDEVCRHGGLRRKCETCDLEADCAALESRIAALRAGLQHMRAATCETGQCVPSDMCYPCIANEILTDDEKAGA